MYIKGESLCPSCTIYILLGAMVMCTFTYCHYFHHFPPFFFLPWLFNIFYIYILIYILIYTSIPKHPGKKLWSWPYFAINAFISKGIVIQLKCLDLVPLSKWSQNYDLGKNLRIFGWLINFLTGKKSERWRTYLQEGTFLVLLIE